MKAVMLSLRPQWCEKIFNGSKTIEVRKSRPSIPTPFTVYVYCTKAKSYLYRNPNNGELFLDSNGGYRGGDYEDRYLTGKVIGSFVCDQIFEIPCETTQPHWLKESTRLTDEQYMEYLGNKNGYGWHITEPKLFEKPRDITEFALYGKCAEDCDEYDICARDSEDGRMSCKFFKRTFLKRPPQSYCYVEADER